VSHAATEVMLRWPGQRFKENVVFLQMGYSMSIRIILYFLVANLATVALAQQSDIADTDARVTPEEFPIFPWDILKPDKAVYEEAKACGFNLAGFVHPPDLDLVAAAGMKCFVSDPSIHVRGGENLSADDIKEAATKLAKATASHPATFGYHIVDEPNKQLVPVAAKWAAALDAAAPNAIAYTNFLPIAGNASGNGDVESDYEQYLTSYIDLAKPKAISFDHYSMMDDGTVRPTCFDGLEVVRRTSQKTGVPFWNVVLANTHFRYAEPSPATLRFQAFTSLAYGARGIGWFTYTGRDRGNYRSAAIDLAGRRTPTWEMLRDVNLQLHRLAPVYTKLKSVNVFHYPDVPRGCRSISESKFVKDLRGEGPFVVGEFEDAQRKPALIVVNRNLNHSTQLEVILKSKVTIQRVSPYTGRTRAWGAEDNWLAPGQGILLMVGADK
jgi:hypothetical protein